MGSPLKDALKTICGFNQWSYAVFWKTGSQNPKLLIWEDCYYGGTPHSLLPGSSKIASRGRTLQELENCWLSPEDYAKRLGAHVADPVHLLVNKMMMANQVHVVGEGLVGRAVFTGNHQWIMSGTFNGLMHPLEVINEAHLQFSYGMQTIAVIPIQNHGVVQLGSSMAIIEDFEIIRYVKTLVIPQVCTPTAVLSENFLTDDDITEFGMPMINKPILLNLDGNTKNFGANDAFACGTKTNLLYDLKLASQTSHSHSSKMHDTLKPIASAVPRPNQSVSTSHWECQPLAAEKADLSCELEGPFEDNAFGAKVSPAEDLLLKQRALNVLGSGSNHAQRVVCRSKLQEERMLLDVGSQCCDEQGSVASSGAVQSHLLADGNPFSQPSDSRPSVETGGQINSPRNIFDGFSRLADHSVPNSVLSGCFNPDVFPHKNRENGLSESLNMPSVAFSPDFNTSHYERDIPSCMTSLSDNWSSGGGDLFDALGVDFKNRILDGCIIRSIKNGNDRIAQMNGKSQDLTSLPPIKCDELSQTSIFPASSSDHLLDAVVTGVWSAASQISNDNLSCETTMTKSINSSAPSSSHCSMSDQMHTPPGYYKPCVRSVDDGTVRTGSALGKTNTENRAQANSFNSSCVSSWVEQGQTPNHGNTVATANSKKFGLVGKAARRRLKPGENPKPRPKDRQMIQDRVKELREIIPNGEKCSIDSLLERTIKHMIFLQSINKHADRLKQTAESKIINKDGGLVPKDNFEGGATWAYEVGSQARICPIIVEDLDSPRQFHVEMLCEQRGLFLEIAGIIRGLGLNILKGVMETLDDKIRARFSVEANRDVTRMEIFLSLVHLLDGNVATNSDGKINHPASSGWQ